MVSIDRAPARRADAHRNRTRILEVAREAFDAPGVTISMAEIARRAGVGMATLYRNFPGRRELLEALFDEDVSAVCAAADQVTGLEPQAAAETWLRTFAAFLAGKHLLAGEILQNDHDGAEVLHASRSRVLAAGKPLIVAAQHAGTMRDDLTPDQIFDLVVAVGEIPGSTGYAAPILQVALDGLRATGQPPVG